MSKGIKTVLHTERDHGSFDTAVYVYADRIELAALDTPTNYRDWRTVQTWHYQNATELREALDAATSAPNANLW